MAALKPITAAALLAMLAFPAHADVTGPACVTDGDTLVVNGKRERTRCVGGTPTLVAGSDTFNVGATLHVGATQAAGTYSGTFPVTVNYK